MYNEPIGFSKYLVIFIDILGSQNRSDFQEVYEINKIFHEELEKNQSFDKPHTVYFRKIYSFSDCAYIFYGFKEDVEDSRKNIDDLFKVALCNCESIFIKFISKRILIRGGIYYGDAYIDKARNMFFGEAVNNAYKLESKVAIHPRIVVDSYVAQQVQISIDAVKYKMVIADPQNVPYLTMGLMPRMPETGDGIIEKDVDGQYILNFLHFPENNICTSEYVCPKNFIEDIIEYCQEQIEKITDFKIIDKYYYLLRFAQKKLENLISPVNLLDLDS